MRGKNREPGALGRFENNFAKAPNQKGVRPTEPVRRIRLAYMAGEHPIQYARKKRLSIVDRSSLLPTPRIIHDVGKEGQVSR
jgi:hypothetical protein